MRRCDRGGTYLATDQDRPGGVHALEHRDGIIVGTEQEGEESAESLRLYACSDGLVRVFAYRQPQNGATRMTCPECKDPIEEGEAVQRACPRQGCAILVHAECATDKCPVCMQDSPGPTGEADIWIPSARQAEELTGAKEETACAA